MQRHNHTALYPNSKQELVYNRLYRDGLQLYEKRAALYHQNSQPIEDPECTFQPNLKKKVTRLKRYYDALACPRVNKQNSKTPDKSNPRSQLSPNGSISARSRFAIKKDINNIAIRGAQKSYLQEAREAAVKRSREFNDRYGNMNRKINQRQCITPRSKNIDRLFFYQINEPQMMVNTAALKQVIVKSKTPKANGQKFKIIIPQTDYSKTIKSQSIKPKVGKNTKRKEQNPIIDSDELPIAIKNCIEKAMMLSQTLDKEIISRRKHPQYH